MSHFNNRNKIINRIERELIGPGSDIFYCDADFANEIIEGKPLQRYYTAILFPKQKTANDEDNGKDIFIEDENQNEIIEGDTEELEREGTEKEKNESDDETDEVDTIPKYNSNAFYPSHFGFSFSVSKQCDEIDVQVSFGNYKKANFDEIVLPYNGSDLNLLTQFGFDQFAAFDETTKTLKLLREIKRTVKGQLTADYLALQSAFKGMSDDHRSSAIFKHLTKLFFKDKYKRFGNEILVKAKISDLLNAENAHVQFTLSEQSNARTENWHKDNLNNLILHLKLYDTKKDKYFIKAIIENTYAHKKEQFAISKEKLNQLALFQTEIKANSDFLIPFRDYHAHLYKTEEDKMLDYLFRNKLAYGIGHNTSCTWENCEQDEKPPSWIKTTFLPAYNVKSQSTQTDKIANEILSIRNLSSFGKEKKQIIDALQKVSNAYLHWINDESKEANGNEFGEKNIEKCKEIHRRIEKGIGLLSTNNNAFKAFQYANAAIFIQMFQNEWHFNKKDGYEVFERNSNLQLIYNDYSSTVFPNEKEEPSWRPFQLAFILQSIPSFIEENCSEKNLVDLLYFPTGGGKTEAYLAVSAFLIFWRRLTFSNQYDGVNIIIRYTLRLLSAQQFERATKLILACEFIRQNNKELGEGKVSIGFWIGNATIPNDIERAKQKYNYLLKKLNERNFDGKKAINPFQLTNCQWCNSKIISRINSIDTTYVVGHRINSNLQSYCLNPKCNYNETNGGLPIVLIDDDIYNKPPTVLFGTVDKFAALAWKPESTALFNYKENRKPELIIQDELHLLNGPLGSLVGLFENTILSLCTTDNQRPKIIASTATIKNVEAQILGLYGREARIFPQYATNSDDTFFSKTLEKSKRKYIGVLPTGKTAVMTHLALLSALLYARLEIWEQAQDKKDADQFWTLLSYFKSLKEIGRFSNKVNSELKPIIQQLQVRHLKNHGDLPYNYWKLSSYDRVIELTSRIPNEKIKKNLDKLDKSFNGNLKESNVAELVLATNMISVGLDIGRLGIMVMNGMPPNTAEYIQASSRVARTNEGIVVTLFDAFNTRDLSYYEDFVQFHKTFYKQVEPLSVTPFADSALDKMLFTLIVAYFRNKFGRSGNDMASALLEGNFKNQLRLDINNLFANHPVANKYLITITDKVNRLIEDWEFKIQASKKLFYSLKFEDEKRQRLLIPVSERKSAEELRITMYSMRNVEPNAEIFIKQH